jgi:hypothetical protein
VPVMRDIANPCQNDCASMTTARKPPSLSGHRREGVWPLGSAGTSNGQMTTAHGFGRDGDGSTGIVPRLPY